MENIDNLSVAERYYQKHLLAVHRYEDKNRDKIREKNKNYYLKLKNLNIDSNVHNKQIIHNDKYIENLDYHKKYYNINKDNILDKSKQNYIINKEQKKMYYQNVIKPKLLLKKQLLLNPPTE